MPQIGWLEILFVVIVAILILGPKEFPIVLKKIGIYVGKFKNTISWEPEYNFQTTMTDLLNYWRQMILKFPYEYINR